ncbi:hypothetical protein WA026_020307 [Henosepilachna vigintioctopunctata]|uniref:TEP1-F n=1 Tax=Henosepilachna vigintioctopunctata TaxID=420089 RepID=A0AAW1TX23_9CUCU
MLCVFFLVFFLLGNASADGYYRVIGSKTVRPQSEYHVSVSIEGAAIPTFVKSIIEGVSFNGSAINIEDEKDILPYTSQIFTLKVPIIPVGVYRLQVQGRGGVDFQSYYPLDYLEKSYSVLIETDKPIYDPGTKVLFRVIVLNSELKPSTKLPPDGITIRAVDNDGNKIRVWKNVETVRGVFSGEFNLSLNPVLGNWNITVDIQSQQYFKGFRVARYILPGFRIDVDTKTHVTFQDGKIIANIKTYYHHGAKLEGEATISAFPTIFSHVIQPIFQNPIRKVISIDGSATVEFDIDRDLRLNDEYERIVILDVAVEEKLTGRRENTTVKVHVHKYNYKIDLIKTSDYFKPGLKYIAFVKLSRHDNQVLRSNEEITVKHGFSQADEVPIERKHRLDKNGVTKLEFLSPVNVTNTTALRIEAQFEDLKERISPVLAAQSYSHNFLQVSLETDRVLVNLEVEVSVLCTEPMKFISYVVLGRGDVLLSKTIPVNNKKDHQFRFRALHSMVPLAHLIVSYIRDNGEMIGDTLDIEVDGVLQNFLDVKSSTVETEPGLDVDIQMKTQPFSYVGLMAVDQRNEIFGEGNEISNSMIEDELFSYDSALKSEYLKIMTDGKSHFPWKPGGSNIYSGIEDSGADLITNAHILRKKPTLDDIYLRPTVYDSSTVKPDRGFGLHFQTATRPPLAGPYAFSRIPVPVWNIPKVYLKDEIADTWIYANYSARYDGIVSTRKKLPNSLSNWIMTGFSLDPVFGLGIMTSKRYRTTSPFFVKVDLPYRMHRGESINVPVFVYNRMDEDADVEVTMHNADQNFEFTAVSNEIAAPKSPEFFRRKRISVKKDTNGTVWFLITPKKLGLLEIKITANNPSTQDAITEYLMVEAEGETEYYTKSELLDLRKTEYVKKTINFTIPKNAIPGSVKVEVASVGNIFGPTLKNLDSVIRKPTGCGEQNLLYMMTSLIVLKYMKSSQHNLPQIRQKAIDYLQENYQTQLSFKRNDGSFSVFGKKDDEGSMWLTAYTLMTFRQSSEFIFIDESVVEKGYDWLAEKQSRNGSFYETGNEIYFEMQDKNGNSLPLTSFVLISFLENQKFTSKYKNTINKGLDYIARYIDESEETYSIALCSYILQISRHPSKQSAFNLLDNRAEYKDNMKWWAKPKTNKNNPWNDQPRSVDIEMTSYALLTFLENNLVEDSIPIINWLLKQQNSNGGFASTQDTVMGLQALFKLVMKLSTPANIQIEFTYNERESGRFHISQNDALSEQRFEINNSSRQVNVTAKGKGFAFFRVYYRFNKDVTGPWPQFILDPQVDKNSNRDHLQLSICTRFVKDNKLSTVDSISNMAVMEVNLPSGYIVDVHSLPSLEVSQHVQKVEAKHRLTKVILYFNNISSAIEYCPTVSAFRTHKVAGQKSVPVILYDYYDTSRRARVFYKPPTTTVCDICTDVDCESACVISPKPQIREGESNQKNQSPYTDFTLLGAYLPLLILLNILLI